MPLNSTRDTLSARLSRWVVLSVSVLFVTSLGVMLYYSRSAIRDEAVEEARQALEGTVQYISNTLDHIEMTAGITLHTIQHNLDKPEMMPEFARRLVEQNKNLTGCVIAFEPGFMAPTEPNGGTIWFAYRPPTAPDDSNDIPIIGDAGEGSYTNQEWYTNSIALNESRWVRPFPDDRPEGSGLVTTYNMIITDEKGKTVGVFSVGISLDWLSKVVSDAKPFPNSHSMVMGQRTGQVIVHPQENKEKHAHAFQPSENGQDESIRETTKAMMAGETGYRQIRLDGANHYIFYEPLTDMKWSVAIVCPDEDFFGPYNDIMFYGIAIAIACLMAMSFMLPWLCRKRLMPLTRLAAQAQHIAAGNYNGEPLPLSTRKDEVGRLQNDFRTMQKSLTEHISETERLSALLNQRNEELQTAYEQAREADRVKSAFLQNMSDQMVAPVKTIVQAVDTIGQSYATMEQEENSRLVDSIQENADQIGEILNEILDVATGNKEAKGKEGLA